MASNVTVSSSTAYDNSTDVDDSLTTAGGTALSLFLIVLSSLVTTFGLFFQKIAQERFEYAKHTFGDDDDDREKTKKITESNADDDYGGDGEVVVGVVLMGDNGDRKAGWTTKEIADYRCKSWLFWFGGFLGITLISVRSFVRSFVRS